MAFDTIDLRPVYLVSLEAISSMGNITILKIGFNLACGIENGTTLVVDVVPLNNNNDTSMSQRQIHDITDKIIEEQFFRPQQVFLTFMNITTGLDYTVQARLLNSEGDIIGAEFHMNISVPSGTHAICYTSNIYT